ncbi:MAG: KpsF/GutQ family sugar-phosphate isomerase [Candidatus Obscuribacterales bacterium]|nr:KpsF/GutQ family sugar-phosphate isomerase [Candidatus Obscuribacterales bacterium]
MNDSAASLSFAPQATTSGSALSGNISQAQQVLKMEAESILSLADRLGDSFDKAIELLLNCQGKIVVTGMGKSGHIGNKIAATLASTGSPAFFVHPAELRHGDFGMLDPRDVVIALSGSGETQEIKLVLDPIKRLGLPIIALTGNLASTLAKHSETVIDVRVEREACPLNLAPTSSTTAALAMGDALAVVLMIRKGFKADDFARSHPGGNLGSQLVTVTDVMRSGIEIPTVRRNAPYPVVVAEIDQKRLGFTCVVEETGSLCGIITDGDVRRALVKWSALAFEHRAEEIMSLNPKTIAAGSLAVEALKIMESHSISDLLILNEMKVPVGAIHLKDLLKAGIV